MKRLLWGLIGVICVLATAAHAAVVRVSQESSPGMGDFSANVLGYVEPYGTDLSAEDYYGYSTVFKNSYGGPDPTLTSDRSHLFLVEAADGLSVFTVHDAPQDDDGGRARMTFQLFSDPDGAAILAKDDPYSDVYTGDPGGSLFTTDNPWIRENTDGVAIGSLDGPWSLLVDFDEVSVWDNGRLLSWAAYSGDGSVIPLEHQPDRRVKLDPVQIPEPSGFLIWGLTLPALGWWWRRSVLRGYAKHSALDRR